MRSRRIRPSSTPISASRIKEHCVIALGQFLEVLIGGLMSGVLYSLVALGFVLIFKASGVFNFAQGAMVLLAGLALVRSLDLLVANGFPLWAAIIFGIGFAVVIMAITAWLIERFVIGPLVNQDGLTLFMSTIGVTFILEGAAQMIFGSDAYPLRLFPTDAWFLFENLSPGGILVNELDVWGGLIAGILVAGLAVFFQRTKTGRALRAVADDHLAAQSVGIPISWIWFVVWFVAGAARAAAGFVRRADQRSHLRRGVSRALSRGWPIQDDLRGGYGDLPDPSGPHSARHLARYRLHRGAAAGNFPHLAVRQRLSAARHSAALPDPRTRRYRRKHSRRLLRPDLARQRRVHGHRRLLCLQVGDRRSYSARLARFRDFDPAVARAVVHFARRAYGGGCRNPLRCSQSTDQGPLSGGCNARSAVLLRLGVPAGVVVHQLRAVRVGQCADAEFLRSGSGHADRALSSVLDLRNGVRGSGEEPCSRQSR